MLSSNSENTITRGKPTGAATLASADSNNIRDLSILEIIVRPNLAIWQ
jgi:hypothetical protein